MTPIIYWVRRDFRLGDNAALAAAAKSGRPVIPVFILDEVMEAEGACPKWRRCLGAETFARSLVGLGSRLIFRRGRALDVLCALVRETGAEDVWWARLYDPDSVTRDTAVKVALKADGVGAMSFAGHVLHEPWDVETKTGDVYKVYSPYWRTVKDLTAAAPIAAPTRLNAPEAWPPSDDPAGWGLDAAMNRGAGVVQRYLAIGEEAAAERLATFMDTRVADYAAHRNIPSVPGTSRLSENLTYGEISPRTCWHAGFRALNEGKAGAETFLKELVWREFAYHLVYHTPRITSRNWRDGWDGFPWQTNETAEITAWKQGRTGMPFVYAAMRELYVTGYMHNRARMIVASYLTKHLLADWRIGLKWFADTLFDWDPASNAMGWQWTAGSGPDAAPYFRVFNPETQLDKFDEDRIYVDRWIAEGRVSPSETALSYFDAIPQSWGLSPDDPYPAPVVSAADGRKRALGAYEAWKSR